MHWTDNKCKCKSGSMCGATTAAQTGPHNVMDFAELILSLTTNLSPLCLASHATKYLSTRSQVSLLLSRCKKAFRVALFAYIRTLVRQTTCSDYTQIRQQKKPRRKTHPNRRAMTTSMLRRKGDLHYHRRRRTWSELSSWYRQQAALQRDVLAQHTISKHVEHTALANSCQEHQQLSTMLCGFQRSPKKFQENQHCEHQGAEADIRRRAEQQLHLPVAIALGHDGRRIAGALSVNRVFGCVILSMMISADAVVRNV